MMEGFWCQFRREARAHGDSDTAVVVDGLKALDPKWPIREADMAEAVRHHRGLGYSPDAVRTWQIANGSGATPALRQQSSTARAPRPPRPAAHAVTMLENPDKVGFTGASRPSHRITPMVRTSPRPSSSTSRRLSPASILSTNSGRSSARPTTRPIGKCWKACRRRSARWSRRSCGTILASLPRQHWSA